MILADQFYSSGTFWGAAGVAMGALTIALEILRSPNRGRLICELAVDEDAARATQGAKSFRRVRVRLENHIHHDIRLEDFTAKEPLRIDVGARIIGVTEAVSGPFRRNSPRRIITEAEYAVNGQVLEVKPRLFQRGHRLEFWLQIDDKLPRLEVTNVVLADVKLQVRDPNTPQRPTYQRLAVNLSIALVAAVAGGLIIYAVKTPSTKRPGPLIAELGSPSRSSRITAVRGLGDLLRSDPADQPTITQALARFIQTQSPYHKDGTDTTATPEVQSAAGVLRDRNPAHDGSAALDLDNANLTGTDLRGISLVNANLTSTDLTDADLSRASLRGADLQEAYLGGSELSGADLTDVHVNKDTSFFDTSWCKGSQPVFPLSYDCTE